AGFRKISDIGDIRDDLHDVIHGGALRGQQTLDLVVGILALAGEITQVPDGSALAIFIFSANAGQEDHLSWVSDRQYLGKQPLSPFAVIVVFLFEASRTAIAGLSLRPTNGAKNKQKCSRDRSHVNLPLVDKIQFSHRITVLA